jgi:hypothetical protein
MLSFLMTAKINEASRTAKQTTNGNQCLKKIWAPAISLCSTFLRRTFVTATLFAACLSLLAKPFSNKKK